MDTNALYYQLGLYFVYGVGNINAKKLVAYCGGVKEVFETKKKDLIRIPGIGEKIVSDLLSFNNWDWVEEEIKFIERNNIRPLFYLDHDFPTKLKQFEDGPIMLFAKGNFNLNPEKTIAIVGTRNATDYGKMQTEKLVADLVPHNPTIISGLAFGIDITAHKASMDNGLETWGIMGNGLHTVYPAIHKKYVEKMLENGGVFSEFNAGVKPDRENFPQRNRIVAALADAVVVVEAADRGGALITAELANDYSRDVFAFPGRINDEFSRGCNRLIKQNKASLIESVSDIEYMLGWARDKKNEKPAQISMFYDLTEEEDKLISLFKDNGASNIDVICNKMEMTQGKVSAILLNLELNGIIRSLPGKMYDLNK